MGRSTTLCRRTRPANAAGDAESIEPGRMNQSDASTSSGMPMRCGVPLSLPRSPRQTRSRQVPPGPPRPSARGDGGAAEAGRGRGRGAAVSEKGRRPGGGSPAPHRAGPGARGARRGAVSALTAVPAGGLPGGTACGVLTGHRPGTRPPRAATAPGAGRTARRSGRPGSTGSRSGTSTTTAGPGAAPAAPSAPGPPPARRPPAPPPGPRPRTRPRTRSPAACTSARGCRTWRTRCGSSSRSAGPCTPPSGPSP